MISTPSAAFLLVLVCLPMETIGCNGHGHSHTLDSGAATEHKDDTRRQLFNMVSLVGSGEDGESNGNSTEQGNQDITEESQQVDILAEDEHSGDWQPSQTEGSASSEYVAPMIRGSGKAEWHTSCGTSSPSEDDRMAMAQTMWEWKQQHHDRNLQDTEYTIPVHFHVFQPNSFTGAITVSQVRGLVATLNDAFASTPFNFEIASAYRIFNPTYARCDNEVNFKRTYKRGGDGSLNLYLCDLYSRGLGGYAYLPPVTVNPSLKVYDGVVNMNPALPSATDLDVFHTFVHEVGHWLGLLHTFEDGCSARTTYQTSYGGIPYYFQNGDGVEDTASHSGPTWNTREINYCFQGQSLDTCNDQTPGTDQGLDPVDNYMNYIPGRCRRDYGRFTPGQIERMVAEYEKYRLS